MKQRSIKVLWTMAAFVTPLLGLFTFPIWILVYIISGWSYIHFVEYVISNAFET